MKTSDLFPNSLVGVLGLCLASTACIIDDDDGDSGQSGTNTSGSPPTTGETVPDDNGTDTNNDTDSGGGVCEGADNLVSDPGFEMGPEAGVWTATSEIFDTPICDSSCTEEEGAAPYSGDWWVWFGGLDDEPENASVEQSITIPAGDEAQLSFWFQIRSGAGTGEDTFFVDMVDGDIVDPLFTAADTDMPAYSDGYSRVDVDVTPWADGGTYTVRFSASIAGNGLTSFFLDEVSVVSCLAGDTGSTGMATEGEDTTAGTVGTTEGTTEGTTMATEGTMGTTEGTTGGTSSGG